MPKDRYVFPAIFDYGDDGISIEFPDLPGCLPCATCGKGHDHIMEPPDCSLGDGGIMDSPHPYVGSVNDGGRRIHCISYIGKNPFFRLPGPQSSQYR